MKRTNRVMGVILAVFFAGTWSPGIHFFAAGLSFASSSFSIAPINPGFVRHMEQKQLAETLGVVVKEGITPSPFSFPDFHPRMSSISVQALPSSFDLRSEGRVTPVRNQNPLTTCWSFATIGSLESTLMPGETPDLSEYHLAYTAYSGPESFTKTSPSQSVFNQGGNYIKSTALLSRWTGPVNESDCPYDTTGTLVPADSAPPRKHLVNSHFLYDGQLSSDDVRPSIKAAIQARGGTASMMYWDQTNYFESGDVHSYYYAGSSGPNHGILLVGWDDAYPRANFQVSPPLDGAWLVKNSWGTGWGDEGYFWISYGDAALQTAVVFESENPGDNERIYLYDPLGIVLNLGENGGANPTLWAANVFSSASDEELRAVGFWAIVPETAYEIRVYTDVPPENPVGGILAGTINGTAPTAGYHVFELDSPVSLEGGSRFSVVARITTPGFGYPVAVEAPLAGYSENAEASAGESFVSLDGAWWIDLSVELENANACLKAISAAAPSPSPSGGGGGGGGCSVWAFPGAFLLLVPLLILQSK